MNYHVRDYGAVGNGKTKDTDALQKAIDACGQTGGGRVLLEQGVFLTGTLTLHCGVELYIDVSATLLASVDMADFPEITHSDLWHPEFCPRANSRCLIYAEGCEDIALSGRGRIDCQGYSYVRPLPKTDVYYDDGERRFIHQYDRLNVITPPRVVMLAKCNRVSVTNLTMLNGPAGWSYFVLGCTNVVFDRLVIDVNVEFPNNDGIDINCCQDVTISNCSIKTGDDCIALRAYSMILGENTPCERIAVTNCNLVSHTSGIRLGWLGDGVIRNCTFSNLNITDSTSGIEIRIPSNKTGQRWSDQGTEQTFIENIIFSDITIDRGYYFPLQFNIGENDFRSCRAIRSIYVTNMHARTHFMPYIKGTDDCYFENIYLRNCHFEQLPWPHTQEMAEELNNEPVYMPVFRKVRNLVLQDTTLCVE